MATRDLEPRFITLVAAELGCRSGQVTAAAELLAEGATVPFVARYRKEATGGLTDEQLETLAKRRTYFLELTERRDAVLAQIAEQGKLTAELEKSIRGAASKQELEDLYLPYKKKRRTRAEVARERGLEPLAERLLEGARGNRRAHQLAAGFVDPGKDVADIDAALAGARDILAERLAENARHRASLRQALRTRSELHSRVKRGKKKEVSVEGGKGSVYKDYFDHREPASRIPSHRLLAIQRGEREGFLSCDLLIDDQAMAGRLAKSWGVPLTSDCGRQVAAATEEGYKRLLRPSITTQVRRELGERAEAEAIRVFRANLESLLTQAPFGQVPVVGLDPGFRTGCKLAVVDPTGRVLDTGVIYPVEPRSQVEQAGAELVALVRRHQAKAVAIGNGTASRETQTFARQAIREAGLSEVIVAIVPETGASVYSASAVARAELPSLDVSLRGAVSIARRFQDPLAELVKIEPRSLGVGQYQHDVDQKALASELGVAVESTVNRVGVELNSASPSLLRRVSGLSERLATSIVKHRDTGGPFSHRRRLLDVAGFGPKAFELAAGFLRIRDGEHPLDRTGVHPERYRVVEAMAAELGVGVAEVVGEPAMVDRIRFDRFADADQGLGRFTLGDIKHELERPGRDPRPEYQAPELRDDITSIDDLEPGMELEGRVSNVANFGAFVDLGVKRDGLVHVSQLSDTWIDNPREVVRVGQVVRVRVLEVDRQRGRISLSMRRSDDAPAMRRPIPRPKAKAAKAPLKRDPSPSAPSLGQAEKKARSQPPSEGRATVEDLMRKFNRR